MSSSAKTYLYQNYVKGLQTAINSALATEFHPGFAFDAGDEYEVIMCRVLRRILPNTYGIARGHIVSSDGQSVGDDIIIYDQLRMPTLALRTQGDYSQKEFVPVEAVYAYIELKHTLNIKGDLGDGQSLAKARKQVSEAKKLLSRRLSVPLQQLTPMVTLGSTVEVSPPPGYPDTRNPPYGVIFARNVRDKKGDREYLTTFEEIRGSFLRQEGQAPVESEFGADLILLGGNVLMLPVSFEEDPAVEHSRARSPFLALGGPDPHTLGLCAADGHAPAMAILFLLWALEYMELGQMPWSSILDDASGGPIKIGDEDE
ncbi:DUF6602 domain-containing protein [Kineococcus endophyticus]|uniref:DUF6602 domain-containing protein n=1 Tax=Kineococcus endophyticus TaxID=1181883 RepID=A0ABV3PE71_9ACTN